MQLPFLLLIALILLTLTGCSAVEKSSTAPMPTPALSIGAPGEDNNPKKIVANPCGLPTDSGGPGELPPDGRCKDNIHIIWLDDFGCVIKKPTLRANYKVKVDFPDLDCAGKIKADATVLRDGVEIASCKDQDVSKTAPAILCEFVTNKAGLYEAKIKYKDITGVVIEKVMLGSLQVH